MDARTIWGRNPATIFGLVQAVLGLALAFGVPITVQQLGAIEAVASLVIAMIANSATPGTVGVFSRRTKT
jgi:hypothetical protein